jgi:hypothetical protein
VESEGIQESKARSGVKAKRRWRGGIVVSNGRVRVRSEEMQQAPAVAACAARLYRASRLRTRDFVRTQQQIFLALARDDIIPSADWICP